MMRPVLMLFPGLLLLWQCAVVETSCQDFDAGCNPLTVSLLYTEGQVSVPRARNLYVSHSTATTIKGFTISDPGQLSLIQTVALPGASEQLAITADSRFLFAAVGPSNSVGPFAISATGELTPLALIGGFSTPAGVSISSSNRLFVSDHAADSVSSYSIDGNGNVGLLGSTIGSMDQPRSIAIHPGGQFVHVALEVGMLGSALLSLSGGAPAWVSNTNIAGSTNVFGLTYDHSGYFLLAPTLAAPYTLYSYPVSQLNGSLGPVQTHVLNGTVRYGIVSHPALPIVYVAYNTVSPQVEAYAIGSGGTLSLKSSITLPATGTQTLLLDKLGLALYSINGNGNVYGITLNASGDFVSVTGPFFSDTNPMGGALLHVSATL